MNVKTLADKKNIIKSKDNAFELEMDITPNITGITGIELYNAKGENVKYTLTRKKENSLWTVLKVDL